MNKLMLIAHGELATEMKKSAEMIFGELPTVEAVCFFKEEGLETIQQKIVKIMDKESNYILFCDLFCGTPYNASCSVALNHLDREIEVVSGMSLPLVLELANLLNTMNQVELVDFILKASRDVVKKFDRQILEEEEDLLDED